MNGLLHSSALFVKRNASTILSCIGAAGVAATSITAVKATPKALILLDKAKEEKGEELTKLEIVKTTAPVYIPSVLIGTSTIACIFGANVLNKKSQAGLMSAYALVDNSYKEYRNKVKELYGEEGEDQVRTEIAKDKYEEAEIVGDGTELFYEQYSGRYFRSTKYEVQHAQYQLNRDLVMMDCVELNSYYRYLGLPEIDGGDELGWSTGMNFAYYWQPWIDFSHSLFTLDDGTECHKIWMIHEPDVGYTEYY